MKNEYLNKLKDPRWQKKRLQILERDNWACKFCGEKGETLVVHHVFYFRNKEPWEIHNGFLITLCESCHDEEKNTEANAVLTNEIGVLLQDLWKNGYANYLIDIAYGFHKTGFNKTKHTKPINIEIFGI